MNMRPQNHWWKVIFACLVAHGSSSVAQSSSDLSAYHLLSLLRQKDSQVMGQGFQLAGTMRVTSHLSTFSIPGLPSDSDQFELTTDARRMAWRERFLEFHGTPRYVPPSSEEALNDRYDYDDEGNMIFRIISGVDALYEAGVICAKLEKLKLCSITTAGTLYLSPKHGYLLFLYPIEEGQIAMNAARALLGTGRGFSYLIDSPVSVKRRSDGLLEFKGRGRDSQSIQGVPVSVVREYFRVGASGMWVLVIDPAADYLVREAKFYPEGSKGALSAWYTAGVFQTRTGSIAAKGRFVLGPDREIPPNEYDFTYSGFAPSPNEVLYRSVRQQIFDDLPDGITVMDYRHADGQFITWKYRKNK